MLPLSRPWWHPLPTPRLPFRIVSCRPVRQIQVLSHTCITSSEARYILPVIYIMGSSLIGLTSEFGLEGEALEFNCCNSIFQGIMYVKAIMVIAKFLKCWVIRAFIKKLDKTIIMFHNNDFIDSIAQVLPSYNPNDYCSYQYWWGNGGIRGRNL